MPKNHCEYQCQDATYRTVRVRVRVIKLAYVVWYILLVRTVSGSYVRTRTDEQGSAESFSKLESIQKRMV
jgi:hypothetical protein